ncbi:MAG: ribosome silencing factor [Pseudomonadota bacterium]
MDIEPLLNVVLEALDDLKAENIKILNVEGICSVADRLIIATGNSSRHVKSIAKNVQDSAKTSGERPLGVEGEDTGEWILVDLGDIIVHIMQPQTREFYQLEKLWDTQGEIQSAEVQTLTNA